MGAVEDAIVEAGVRCSLTRSVLTEWAASGTPRQRDHLLGYLEAEAASRDAARRSRMLRRAQIPVSKSLDGFDWSPVTLPDGLSRGDLEALSFVDAREDLVLMGDVGTGKTHMACALASLVCAAGREARFFTASSLVMRLRRAKEEGRLDRELSAIGKAEMVVVDELGYLPLDAEGARLLFQVISAAYERQSVVFTGSSTTEGSCSSGASRGASATPSWAVARRDGTGSDSGDGSGSLRRDGPRRAPVVW